MAKSVWKTDFAKISAQISMDTPAENRAESTAGRGLFPLPAV
jgi:hypothetical protein